MYNPCLTCMNIYNRQYTEDCDNKCEFANIVSKVRQYGGLSDIEKVMKGDAIPLVLLDKDHIDYTYLVVQAAKDGVI